MPIEDRAAAKSCSTFRVQPGLRNASLIIVALYLSPLLHPQSSRPGPEIRKTEDGIAYVSAGIGYDSRINLPRYSLRLVFATKSGKYLADIDVEISPGSKGRPSRIHSPGPWLHVDLPPGQFRLKARAAGGQEVGRSFEIVKGRTTQLTVAWDIPDREN